MVDVHVIKERCELLEQAREIKSKRELSDSEVSDKTKWKLFGPFYEDAEEVDYSDFAAKNHVTLLKSYGKMHRVFFLRFQNGKTIFVVRKTDTNTPNGARRYCFDARAQDYYVVGSNGFFQTVGSLVNALSYVVD